MKKTKLKKKIRMKKKKHEMYIMNNISSDARDVESMTTNLVIEDVTKINMKKKKMKRKANVKIESLKEYTTTVDRRGTLVGTVRRERTTIIKNFRKQKEPLMETKMSLCCVL